jgi:hypothetical protein
MLGSEIPSTGVHGPAYGYKSLALPADANSEFIFPITSVPVGLTIDVDEYSGFSALANDGTYVVPFEVYQDGVNIGPSNFTLKFGTNATINLVGSGSTQAALSSTGSVTVTPPAPGVINLAGSNTTQAAISGTGSVTVTPPVPNVINLAGSSSVQHATGGTGSITITGSTGGKMPDASTISKARTVVFPGGHRVVTFGGGKRVVVFGSESNK